MIYLDNAATSFPKPDCMIKSIVQCMKYYCGNPGRSGHNLSVITGEKVFETRNKLAEFIGAVGNGEQIIFTPNTTHGLNMAIKGIIEPGEHVITTSMEHNSVLRPVKAMECRGVSFTMIKADKYGSINTDAVKKAIKENTKIVAVTAASNVTGTIMPVYAVGNMIRQINAGRNKKIIFLVDGAQAVGSMNVDILKMNADIIAFPGHKGLLGPQGTGVIYVRKGLKLKPLIHGGTGTASKEMVQPQEFPEGYEAGTINAPGLAGLCASVEYIESIGINNIENYERNLICAFDSELRNMKKVKVYGPENCNLKTALTSFNIDGHSCEEIAALLNDNFKIAVRAGFHCAGYAHKTIGTWDMGTVRVSTGPFNTLNDMKKAAEAVWKLTK